MMLHKFDAERLRERLEVLDGSRAAERRRAAVRLEDLAALLTLAAVKAVPAAGATPTKAEFDALLADVKTIAAALAAIATALQGRLAR
jgi:hypothetical protein